MSLFLGTHAGETITPDFVSPTVKVVGSPKKPSNAADVILAGNGNDVVNGGGGNDIALLGGGDDRFIWNPGDGSDIVDGGRGTDTLEFNGSGANESMSIGAGPLGTATLNRDVGNIKMVLNDMERIELSAGAGADQIAVRDLASTDVRQVAIDLAATKGGATGDGAADSVSVDGRNSAEQINITQTGDTVVVSGAAAEVTIARTEANDSLTVNGRGGDDLIDASTLPTTSMKLTIDGGAGNDRILGGGTAETLIGGSGNDFIDGNRGNDTAFMGAGDDTFVWDPGDGSDVVEGQAGSDTMLFNGAGASENIDISATGERVRFFRDVGNITMDNNDVETFVFNALGGNDNVVVHDLSGTDAEEVSIDLAGAIGGTTGDGLVDSVTAEGSAANEEVNIVANGTAISVNGLPAQINIANVEATDRLTVNGGAGNDTLNGSTLLATSVALSLDGGAGDDRLLGGAANETLLGGEGNDFIDGNRGNDTAFMGAGDDTFVWDPGDGSDIVEGQDGFDTMLFNGAGASENIDISATGERVRFFRDVGNITMDNNDVEQFVFNALGGNDNVVVHDLSGTDAKKVAIDLAGVAGGTTGDGLIDSVTAEGSAANEEINIAANGTAISVTGLPAEVNLTNVEATDRLTVTGGGGNDTLNGSTLLATSVALSLDGGAGDDRLLGGAANEILLGGEGNDFIDGNRGNDTAFMGAGDDVFQWDPGDGSDIVEGQEGFDTMLFNGAGASENINISANGNRAIFFRDVGNITMDNNDVERLEFNALGGADNVVVNDLSGTDATEVLVDLESALGSGVGDGVVDRVSVNGTAGNDVAALSSVNGQVLVSDLPAEVRIEHAEASDVLEIRTGAGDDVIDGSRLAAGSMSLLLDGGDGEDVLLAHDGGATLLGGAGDDVLIGGDGNDVINGGDGDDVLIGGGGDDLFLHGEATVSGFVAGAGSEDRIDLRGLGLADFDAVLAHAQQSGGSTVLDFGDGEMTLLGTRLSSLHADDFLI
jgi:Ca2+-binding RTX toxin-like protein